MNKYVIFVYSHIGCKTDVWQVEGEMLWDAYAAAFNKYFPDETLPENYSEIEHVFWDADMEFAVWKVQNES